MRARVGDLRVPALLWLGLFLASFTLYGLTSLTSPIVQDLGTTVSNYQTVLVLLALITAAAIPTSHNLGEIYGHRRVVAGALLLSIAAAVIGAMSPTVLGLIAGFGIVGGAGQPPLRGVAIRL